jgi:hypothetical protein
MLHFCVQEVSYSSWTPKIIDRVHATGLCSRPVESSPQPHISLLFLKIHFNNILSSIPTYTKWYLPRGFPIILCEDGCLLGCSAVLAASTSETLVNFYQTTRRNNLEDSHLHTRRHENLKFHNFVWIYHFVRAACLAHLILPLDKYFRHSRNLVKYNKPRVKSFFS